MDLQQQQLLRVTRRHFFRECGVGVGKIALASLLTDAFASRAFASLTTAASASAFQQPDRPSMGSWVPYGLGADTQDLPAFVVMSTGQGISGGAANWSSGFLPTVYAGVRFRNQGDPILDVSSPDGIDPKLQRDAIDLVAAMNRRRLEIDGDPEIATRISQYEMAYRLQTSAPELMDLKSESKETLQMYGCDPAKPSFARACVLARRMIERGVRFVNIYHEGWDAHSDVLGNHKTHCQE